VKLVLLCACVLVRASGNKNSTRSSVQHSPHLLRRISEIKIYRVELHTWCLLKLSLLSDVVILGVSRNQIHLQLDIVSFMQYLDSKGNRVDLDDCDNVQLKMNLVSRNTKYNNITKQAKLHQTPGVQLYTVNLYFGNPP
jgi:hypothetical protein